MMNSIFEKIAEKAEEDRRVAEAEWASLVERLANEEPGVVERDILTLLKRSNRSLDELKKAVDWQKHILSLRATVNEWSTVERAAQRALRMAAEFHLRRQASERAMIAECHKITVSQQATHAERSRVLSAKDELSAILGEPIMLPEVAEVVG